MRVNASMVRMNDAFVRVTRGRRQRTGDRRAALSGFVGRAAKSGSGSSPESAVRGLWEFGCTCLSPAKEKAAVGGLSF